METIRHTAIWHHKPLKEILESLSACESGLSDAEAMARLGKFGPNRLPEMPPPSVWQIILRQFASPLIYVLVLAAVVSIAMGDHKDATFIAAVLTLNAIIGGYQEFKAEKSSQALRKLLEVRAMVLRGGEVRDIPAEEVVPGDLVWLESGNRVPADMRIIAGHGLEIDESLLTGESLPVNKQHDAVIDANAPIGDRSNMGFAGSIVTRGRGKGFVVATGTATLVGQLALDVHAQDGGRPPLLDRMEKFTNFLAIATLCIALAIGAIGAASERYTIPEMFMFVVALSVAAIPEGLPVAMTVALAIATTRMARRGVIVRRLTAVEGLGSCTMIATDKTGTLTVNELTVRDIWLPSGRKFHVTGEGFAPIGAVFEADRPVKPGESPDLDALARAGVLCNEAGLMHKDGQWEWRGDAVDIALLSFGHKLCRHRETTLDACPQINEIPFESEHQFAATFHLIDGKVVAIVKGAPERVLAMCHAGLDRMKVEAAALKMAAGGQRVLALADGLAEGVQERSTPAEPSGLRFLGLIGMIDPLRPGARIAVEACHDAGVCVSMITGDHRVTALAIARDLGMAADEREVITGPELEAKSKDELNEIVRHVRVFARVAPRQKLQIVDALRSAGHYVAVTGDGVNDAPALRASNIGVAMGKAGTDVAREAAELVISDDNFATIVAGIEEGRVAYDNIRKVIYLLISTGAGELVLMALAIFSGMPMPLLPSQLLWLNLVTNGIQDVALAFEPGEGGVLKRKPRSPEEPIIDRLMIERTIVAAGTLGIVGYAVFAWMLSHGWTEQAARNGMLLMMVLFENFHIANCRSETRSAFAISPLRSPILVAGVVAALTLHIAAMHIPFLSSVLECEPVSARTWVILTLCAVVVVPAIELHKFIRNRNQVA